MEARPTTFEPGRKSMWHPEAPIVADGELLDLALKAQEQLIAASSNLADAMKAWNAQEWLKDAERAAIVAASNLAELRRRVPSDKSSQERMVDEATR